ncbi:MAG TPA: hypothetical protein VI140_11165 [Oxalicibacterium sp.]
MIVLIDNQFLAAIRYDYFLHFIHAKTVDILSKKTAILAILDSNLNGAGIVGDASPERLDLG